MFIKNVNNTTKVINIVEIQELYKFERRIKMSEDGNEVEFEFLDLIEYDGESYVVLLPNDDEEEEAGEVLILKLEDNDSEDEESYVSVEDEEILNKVFEIFKDKFKDEFNFIDE